MLVTYTAAHWLLLKEKRARATRIMEVLAASHIDSYTYGSLARGDVNPRSDIDVLVPSQVPLLRVEEAIRDSLHVHGRLIVQATPSHTPKGYIFLNAEETEMVSFPLAPLSPREEEFYRFGGLVSFRELREGRRVPGVDKRLTFISPTTDGHEELPVRGREAEVASKLGISLETVRERVRVLSRRSSIGRTGVFVKYYLMPHQGFEEAIHLLSRQSRPFLEVLKARGVL
jgi:predicted nucleotidyltransferase